MFACVIFLFVCLSVCLFSCVFFMCMCVFARLFNPVCVCGYVCVSLCVCLHWRVYLCEFCVYLTYCGLLQVLVMCLVWWNLIPCVCVFLVFEWRMACFGLCACVFVCVCF